MSGRALLERREREETRVMTDLQLAKSAGSQPRTPSQRTVRLCLILICGVAGCGRQHAEGGGASEQDIPPRIRVENGAVDPAMTTPSGDFHKVEAFQITTSPISVGQYRRCTAAGVCGQPASEASQCSVRPLIGLKGATHKIEGGDALPLTCVTAEQARTYCHWLGGDLVRADQWLLAARGGRPQRYAWGNEPIDLKKYPLTDSFGALGLSDEEAHRLRSFDIGAHPAGASPAGLQDVLLATSEWVAGVRGFPACDVSPESTCAIFGHTPARIQAALVLPKGSRDQAGVAATGAFRCAWSMQ